MRKHIEKLEPKVEEKRPEKLEEEEIQKERKEEREPDRYLERFSDLKEKLEKVETNPFNPEKEPGKYKDWKPDKEEVMDLENQIFILGHPEREVTKEEIEAMTGKRKAKEMLKKIVDSRYERMTESERINHRRKCEKLTKEITEDFLRAKGDFLKDRLEKTEKAEINPFDSGKQSKKYKKRIMKLESEIFENGKEIETGDLSENLSKNFLVEKQEFFEEQLKKALTNPYDQIKESEFFNKWKVNSKRYKLLNDYQAEVGSNRYAKKPRVEHAF